MVGEHHKTECQRAGDPYFRFRPLFSYFSFLSLLKEIRSMKSDIRLPTLDGAPLSIATLHIVSARIA